MILGANQLFLTETSSSTFKILAPTEVSLFRYFTSTKDIEISADTIVVENTIRTKGFNILLKCRKLIFTDQACIDLSGEPSQINFLPGTPKIMIGGPGAHGENGDNGGSGFHAGHLTIAAYEIEGNFNVIANGGKGGRGQDGGAGSEGAKGKSGKKNEYSLTKIKKTDKKAIERLKISSVGGDGFKGGNAGLPGYRGPGGNGGNVTINCPNQIIVSNILLQKGDPGEPAKEGPVGIGGQWGDGGKIEISQCIKSSTLIPHQFEYGRPTDVELQNLDNKNYLSIYPLLRGGGEVFCSVVQIEYGNLGGRGLPGELNAIESEHRKKHYVEAIEGTKQVFDDVAIMSDFFDDQYIDLQILHIENEYLQNGFDGTEGIKERINFLLLVLINRSLKNSILLSKAFGIAKKLQLNLDVFGNSSMYAPILNHEAYRSILLTFFGRLTNVESSYKSYWNSYSDKKSAIDGLMELAKNSRRTCSILLDEQNRISSELRKTVELTLPFMEKRLKEAEANLLLKQQELENAINQLNGECDVASTLKCVAIIVIGIYSGGASIGAAVAAGASLYDDLSAEDSVLSDLWTEETVMNDELKAIGSNSGNAIDSIKNIAEAYANLNELQKKRKVPQFVIAREEFDRVAQAYMDLDEATDYKKAGYDFLSAAESRNQTIVDYNTLLVQYLSLRAKYFSTLNEVDSIEDSIKQRVDPSATTFVISANKIYLDLLSFGAHLIYQESKALDYYFAVRTCTSFSMTDSNELVDAFDNNTRRYSLAKEGYAPKRKFGSGEVKFSLKSISQSAAWEKFVNSEMQLPFSIFKNSGIEGLQLLDYLPRCRITSLKLFFEFKPGMAPTNLTQIVWFLSQSGMEKMYLGVYDSDDDAIVFNHKPYRFTGSSPLKGENPAVNPDFTESELYAGISPFSSWHLVVYKQSSTFTLEYLDDILMAVDGYFVE